MELWQLLLYSKRKYIILVKKIVKNYKFIRFPKSGVYFTVTGVSIMVNIIANAYIGCDYYFLLQLKDKHDVTVHEHLQSQ